MGDHPLPLQPFICGGSASPEMPPTRIGVVILPWCCPLCAATGAWSDGETCHLCEGRGAITAAAAENWQDSDDEPLTPAPIPPAVMGAPCGSCAYRPGAPEADTPPPLEQPFYCHTGMPVASRAYAPTAWANGVPLGYRVCRGWWAAASGQPLTAEAYRPSTDGWNSGAC